MRLWCMALIIGSLGLMEACLVPRDDYRRLEKKYYVLKKDSIEKRTMIRRFQTYFDSVLPYYEIGVANNRKYAWPYKQKRPEGVKFNLPSPMAGTRVDSLKADSLKLPVSELDSLLDKGQTRQTATRNPTETDNSGIRLITQNKRVLLISEEALIFDPQSAATVDFSQTAMERLAVFMRARPRNLFMVEGHADAQEARAGLYGEAAWELSLRRARSVAGELMRLGVPPHQLIVSGRASFAPVAPNSSEPNRRLNRRVEIVATNWER